MMQLIQLQSFQTMGKDAADSTAYFTAIFSDAMATAQLNFAVK